MKKIEHVGVGGAGSESREQQALVSWYRQAGRRLLGLPESALLIAIPNGGARSAITGARLRAEGVVAGVPDLLLAWPSGGRAGLWIELKRTRGGRLSAAQEAVIDDLRSCGYAVAVALGWLRAAEIIVRYVRADGEV